MKSTKHISWRLLFLLAMLGLVGLIAGRLPTPEMGDVAEPVARDSVEETAAIRPERRLDLTALEKRTLPALSTTLFGNVVVVPPAPSLVAPPPLPPKPVAPPLPYTYLGQYRDADGAIVVYLRRGDEVILAKPGSRLDESYHLEADLRHGLTITYLPLKEAQVIPIGNFTQ